jgi:hypothetical protein
MTVQIDCKVMDSIVWRSISDRGKYCPLSKSFLEGTGIVSSELKQLQLETNYLPPSNAKDKNECLSTSAPLHSLMHVQRQPYLLNVYVFYLLHVIGTGYFRKHVILSHVYNKPAIEHNVLYIDC